MRQQARQDLAL